MYMKKLLLSAAVLFLTVGLFAGGGREASAVKSGQTANFATCSVSDVKKALTDPQSVVIDARVSDSYMGWSIKGDTLAGHIKGAVDFSYRWIDSPYDDNKNLEQETRAQVLNEALQNKHLTKDKNIIVYDTNGSDAKKVAVFLKGLGFEKIRLFDAREWVKAEGAVEQYPHYQLLLPPEVVYSYVTTGKGVSLDTSLTYKIFNVAWGEIDQSGYLNGHIPSAVHVNTDWFEPEEIGWMLADDSVLEKLVLRLGVSAQDGAIVTGPEPMAASRFATILTYLGVKDVRVLNGALIDWQQSGYELAKENTPPQPIQSFGAKIPMRENIIDTMAETQENLKKKSGYVLVDNRTPEEYAGKSSGYSYHDKAGRIAGAVFGYAGKKSSSSMSYYRNIDKTMRNGYEILAMLQSCGIDTRNQMSFMCGSGWRAAEVLWYMRVMGFENVSLYSDGWIGWSNKGLPSIKD